MTSQSIAGRTDFPDYDMLDSMNAFALKNLLDKHVHCRRGVSVQEQRARKYYLFLRGRQIAYMISDHIRSTGAYEAVQGLSDFQHTLTKWRRPRFRCTIRPCSVISSETLAEMFLEGLFKWKLQDSVQLQTVLALYDQETFRNNGQPSFSILKICKTLFWSNDENSKLPSPKWNGGEKNSKQESKRKESLRWEESGRMLTVESKGTMFERRFM